METRFDNVNFFGADARLHFGNVRINGDTIERVETLDPLPHAGAKFVLPGCIDTHTHAMIGSEYFDEDERASAAARQALAKAGTTSFLFATMAMGEEQLKYRCRAAAKAVKKRQAEESRCLGVYLEGPFISNEKRGAHNPDLLHLPDEAMLTRLDEAAEGCIRAVCMAPELEGATELAKKLKGKKVVSFAHSAADYDKAKEAFDSGFSNLTHAFNCMQPMMHRAPGPIAAAADTDFVTAELIDDARHVQPPMIRALFKLMGPERIILISDSIEACGMPDGLFEASDGMIIRLEKGRATVNGTNTLAGSVVPLFAGVRTIAVAGIPLERAIAAATVNPARKYGLDKEIGSITEGLRADIIACTDKLEIEKVYIDGEEITN